MRLTPRAARRRRARAFKSAMNRPRAFGTKAASAPKSPFTSCLANLRAPLQSARVQWQAPSHATSRSGATCSASTVASITPPASPRQPACAAAIRSPESARQHNGQAVRRQDRAQPAPRRRVNAASAGPTGPEAPSSAGKHSFPPLRHRDRPDPQVSSVAASRSTTFVPCTCASHAGSAANPRRRLQAPSILPHRLKRIPHMITQVERRIARRTHPAAPKSRQRPAPPGGGRPFRLEPRNTHRARPRFAPSGKRGNLCRVPRILAQHAEQLRKSPAARGLWRVKTLPRSAGCSNPSVAACKGLALETRAGVSMSRKVAPRGSPNRPPYTGSPTMGYLMCDRCRRIW